MNNNPNCRYFAFISYNQKDAQWGKRLQRKLEEFKLPSILCQETGWKRNPMRPVFFAPYEIQPGDLDEELKARLRDSKNLIVICSPNSAQSEWVGKEIRYFYKLGRIDHIYFFIVNGEPNVDSDLECFNPVIKELGLAGYLGVNIREKVFRFRYLNTERAYIQLITKLLGIQFDSIWQRHLRLLRGKIVLWCTSVILILFLLYGVWASNYPVDVKVKCRESSEINLSLPQLKDLMVTMVFNNDTTTKVIRTIDQVALFPNIPKKAIGKQIKIIVTDSLNYYETIDTTLQLTSCLTLDIHRNPQKYGIVNFRLIDFISLKPISDCKVSIEGIEGITDCDGNVSLQIPINLQKTQYRIKADVELIDDVCSGEYDEDGFVVFANK